MNEPFKIEKNVPYRGSEPKIWTRKYPFNELEVGDSFFVPAKDNTPASRHYVQSLICAYYKKLRPKKFTARSVEGGIRVWRLA
jgi:hypothetical protein